MSAAVRVGFIGLGDQGAPMEIAIAEKFDLHVWARRAVSYDVLGSARYVKETDPVELAGMVDVLCLCLRGDADLHDLLSERSLLKALGNGGTVVNHVTVDPAEAEGFELMTEEQRVYFLDAPVSGGGPGAESRSMTCFIGGRVDALERSRFRADREAMQQRARRLEYAKRSRGVRDAGELTILFFVHFALLAGQIASHQRLRTSEE